MTPDEAANFFEDDEDPDRLIARFDAVLKGVTTPGNSWARTRERIDAEVAAECPVCHGHYADLTGHLALNYKGCGDAVSPP